MKKLLLAILGIFFVVLKCSGDPILNDEHIDESYREARSRGPYSYQSYLSFKQMESRLKYLETRYPNKIKLEIADYTEEKNKIYLLTITDNVKRASLDETSDVGSSYRDSRRMPFVYIPPGTLDNVEEPVDSETYSHTQNTRASLSGKPVIFVDAGIHAREWVAPHAAFFLIDKLLENPHLTSGIEWKIMPMVNPDGYIYSQISPATRYWRKNRARTKGHPNCMGVDLNRNFDVHWKKTNQNACTDTYSGTKAFSEPESRAIRDSINKVKDRMQAYVTIHTYGQLFLYPYGYTAMSAPREVQKLKRMGDGMAKAIDKKYGNTYHVLQASSIGAAAGGSDDWAYMEAKVPYSYTFELQSSAKNLHFSLEGFNLPAYKLLRAVSECWTAVDYMANKILLDSKNVRVQQEVTIHQPEATDFVARHQSSEEKSFEGSEEESFEGSEEESFEGSAEDDDFSSVIRANLPELIWKQFKSNQNIAKDPMHQKREVNKKKDCVVIDYMYICPHMIFWNSMFN